MLRKNIMSGDTRKINGINNTDRRNVSSSTSDKTNDGKHNTNC